MWTFWAWTACFFLVEAGAISGYSFGLVGGITSVQEESLEYIFGWEGACFF